MDLMAFSVGREYYIVDSCASKEEIKKLVDDIEGSNLDIDDIENVDIEHGLQYKYLEIENLLEK